MAKMRKGTDKACELKESILDACNSLSLSTHFELASSVLLFSLSRQRENVQTPFHPNCSELQSKAEASFSSGFQ